MNYLGDDICVICMNKINEGTRLDDAQVHEGKCAVLAGFLPKEHTYEGAVILMTIHSFPPGSTEREEAVDSYYEFADRISSAI